MTTRGDSSDVSWCGLASILALGLGRSGANVIDGLREAEWLIGRALSGNPSADIADGLPTSEHTRGVG
jgi:hypothetical protein